MAKKIQKTDNTENSIQSKKETSKHIKLSNTFRLCALACSLEVRVLFKELEDYYLANKNLFDINKISKLTDSVYKFEQVEMTPILETSLNFYNQFSENLKKEHLSPNRVFSLLLVFRAENDENFLFKIKDLDFKKQYTKDSLTSIFQEYNKNLNILHKENIELKNQLYTLGGLLVKEREEAQEIRLQEKEDRKKDRELLKKVLSAMQDLNNSNVTERTKFINSFETRFQKMENRFDILVDSLDVIVTNLENLSSDDVE